MNLRAIVFCLPLLLSISSCVSVKGLTDGYDALSSTNKKRVVLLGDSTCESIDGDAITKPLYLVTADELKAIIEESKKSYQIVYVYNPNCPSDVCVPMAAFSTICKEYDAEPIVLARYLDNALFDQYVSGIPVYGINHSRYKPKVVYKYVPLFLTDLTGKEMQDDGSGNLFLFEKGTFVARTDVNNIADWFAPNE